LLSAYLRTPVIYGGVAGVAGGAGGAGGAGPSVGLDGGGPIQGGAGHHPQTSTPQSNRKREASVIVISDSEDESSPAKAPRVLPNLLKGVNIPDGPERTGEECSVCLDPPVHPVSLPCNHIFCYLCAKGLASGTNSGSCSLCRKDIPRGFLESAAVLAKASQELNDTPPLLAEDEYQWFYEGRNGWWRFEARNNDELEANFYAGNQQFETLICGNLYVMDLVNFNQFQKSTPQRKRRIKRDLKTSLCKGVAGVGKKSWQQGPLRLVSQGSDG